jgi:hypothetical protein
LVCASLFNSLDFIVNQLVLFFVLLLRLCLTPTALPGCA